MTLDLSGMLPEKTITQQMRQQAFDNYETTDDHGMLIMGVAEDQNGNQYYKVKNSWGDTGAYHGYLYASVPFVLYKSTGIMVRKDVLPEDLKAKLGIRCAWRPERFSVPAFSCRRRPSERTGIHHHVY